MSAGRRLCLLLPPAIAAPSVAFSRPPHPFLPPACPPQIAFASAVPAVIAKYLDGSFPIAGSETLVATCALSMRSSAACTSGYVTTTFSILISSFIIALQVRTAPCLPPAPVWLVIHPHPPSQSGTLFTHPAPAPCAVRRRRGSLRARVHGAHAVSAGVLLVDRVRRDHLLRGRQRRVAGRRHAGQLSLGCAAGEGGVAACACTWNHLQRAHTHRDSLLHACAPDPHAATVGLSRANAALFLLSFFICAAAAAAAARDHQQFVTSSGGVGSSGRGSRRSASQLLRITHSASASTSPSPRCLSAPPSPTAPTMAEAAAPLVPMNRSRRRARAPRNGRSRRSARESARRWSPPTACAPCWCWAARLCHFRPSKAPAPAPRTAAPCTASAGASPPPPGAAAAWAPSPTFSFRTRPWPPPQAPPTSAGHPPNSDCPAASSLPALHTIAHHIRPFHVHATTIYW